MRIRYTTISRNDCRLEIEFVEVDTKHHGQWIEYHPTEQSAMNRERQIGLSMRAPRS